MSEATLRLADRVIQIAERQEQEPNHHTPEGSPSAVPQDMLCKRIFLGAPGSSPAPAATLERGGPRGTHKNSCGDTLGMRLGAYRMRLVTITLGTKADLYTGYL